LFIASSLCKKKNKRSTTRLSGINYVSSGATSPNFNDKVTKMEIGLATLKNQVHTLLAYITSRPDMQGHFATMPVGLVHVSINEV